MHKYVVFLLNYHQHGSNWYVFIETQGPLDRSARSTSVVKISSSRVSDEAKWTNGNTVRLACNASYRPRKTLAERKLTHPRRAWKQDRLISHFPCLGEGLGLLDGLRPTKSDLAQAASIELQNPRKPISSAGSASRRKEGLRAKY